VAILTFSGDFVAAQFSIDDNEDGETEFEINETPFLASDIIRIEIDDNDILPNGEFHPDEVKFLSFSVERNGVEYEFGVDSGAKVKESGGGSNAEQGDTYFLTNDSVSPPSSGPFSGLDEQTYLFSSAQSFGDGPGEYTLLQDAGGAGSCNFNVQNSMVCFCRGTRLSTADGLMAVEDISVGTLVETVDHGLQPVRFVTRSRHTWPAAPNKNKPVLIGAGALGAGIPQRDLLVSPHHRMLMPNLRMPGTSLAPAKALCSLPKVRFKNGARRAEYFHILLDRHEIVFAEGVPTESFSPGSSQCGVCLRLTTQLFKTSFEDPLRRMVPIATSRLVPSQTCSKPSGDWLFRNKFGQTNASRLNFVLGFRPEKFLLHR
jgi:hypothetical protein